MLATATSGSGSGSAFTGSGLAAAFSAGTFAGFGLTFGVGPAALPRSATACEHHG